jgi:tetratricopeptide (TPR) repeat protein
MRIQQLLVLVVSLSLAPSACRNRQLPEPAAPPPPASAASQVPAAAAAPATAAAPAAAPAPAAPQEPVPPTAADLDRLRQQAFAAEAAGDHGSAADAFLALSRAEPLRSDWIVAAGRCLGRSGRFRDAVELLDAARRRFPGAIEVLGMLARTFLLQAERDRDVMNPEILWADAAGLAEEVLAASPDDEDSRLVLAQARYLLGDRDEAVRQAEEAGRRHPQRAGSHVLLGRLALDQLRELRRRHAEQQPTGQEAADLVQQIDRARQQARSSYQRAIELDPTRPFPHIALAQLAMLDQKPEAARDHMLDALVADPDADVDHELLGKGLDPSQRAALYRGAHDRYAKGTESRPAKLATLLFHEGRQLFLAREFATARARLEAALQANPAAYNTHWFLFLCAYHLGDHDAAERHAATYAGHGAIAFADAIRELSGDHRGEVGAIVQFLADRAFQQQRIEASRDLNHVLASLKDTADAWNNHAFLCRETGRFEAAQQSYEYALQREPESPQLWNDAAVVLQYHVPTPANLAKARTMYERALQFADKALADARVTGAERERATKAKADATANLAALPAR